MRYIVSTPGGSSFRGQVKLSGNLPIDKWPISQYVDVTLDYTEDTIRLRRDEVYAITPVDIVQN